MLAFALLVLGLLMNDSSFASPVTCEQFWEKADCSMLTLAATHRLILARSNGVYSVSACKVEAPHDCEVLLTLAESEWDEYAQFLRRRTEMREPFLQEALPALAATAAVVGVAYMFPPPSRRDFLSSLSYLITGVGVTGMSMGGLAIAVDKGLIGDLTPAPLSLLEHFRKEMGQQDQITKTLTSSGWRDIQSLSSSVEDFKRLRTSHSPQQ